MLLQHHLEAVSTAVHQKIGVGDSIEITLRYKLENGHIEPTGSFDMPPGMPENAVRAVFSEMLERQQQKNLDAFRNLWNDRNIEFDFHSRNNLATLTLIKEKSLEEENKTPKAAKAPKASKAPKAAKAKKEKKAKAPKAGVAKKPAPAGKSNRGRKGFSDSQKAEVLDYIKANPGRGVLKTAASKFKVSYPTVNLWVKAAGISPKAPKGSKAAKAKPGVGRKAVSGAILLNGIKYVPAASIKPEKPVKAAKANKGLAKAVKALDKALSLLKKSV
jgi:hypothetical protein